MDVACRNLMAVVTIFLVGVAITFAGHASDREPVVAVFPKHFPPQYFLTPEGEPAGFAIEVMREVAREANLDLQFLPAENWSEANKLIQNGGADLIPNMGITRARAEYVFFTTPYEQFSIRIFVGVGNDSIQSLNDLNGKRVGTTRSNVANSLVKGVDLIRYDDAYSAVKGLLNKELDALVLPDVVVKKLAGDLDSLGNLKVVGEPLKVVQRAIGVSKNKPELYATLQSALTRYLDSNEFVDTQRAWEELPEERWSIQHLTIFNGLFFIVLVMIVASSLYKRLANRTEGINTSHMEMRAVSIFGVFTVAILLSMGGSLWVLYDAAFDEQKNRLVNIAQSRSRIIESIARFDLKKNTELGVAIDVSHQETLSQIREAHDSFKGFGLTGEFTFAKRIDDEISFILRQRHSETIKPQNVPWNAEEAEPMRRALSGWSGTLIGLDYRGVEVLAAHEPVGVIDAGIVAKIDLAEIQLPYIKAGLIALAISQCILLVGYLLFRALAAPILTRLSEAYIWLQALVEHSPNLIVIRNKRGVPVLSSSTGHIADSFQLEEGESRLTQKDGLVHTYLTTKFTLQDQNSHEVGSGQISTDISARVAAETELKQYALAFESTSEGMIITDTEGVILSVNSAFENITGFSRKEVRGQKPNVIKSGHHDQAFYEELWSCLKKQGQWSGEIWNRRKDGEAFPELLNINTVTGRSGEALFYVAVFSDITSLKRTQDELYYLAHHDPLTGLPNRLLFKDRLDHALKTAHREQEMVGVLALDLDRFKNVNDSLGHQAGDQLLKGVAARIEGLVRENDTVSRMGGDEFTIIAEGIKSFRSVSLLAEKIVNGMVHDFNLGTQDVVTSVSLGIAVYPQDGQTHEELLKNADTALYKAKSDGRNNYQFYTDDLSQSAFQKLVMENQISRALHNQEFSVYYQPQFSINSDQLVSAEALVRWYHPELGLVTPDQFIPIAEENGLIVPLGEWVLQSACIQAQKWLESGYEFDRIAVNLAGKQLDRPDLLETVKKALKLSGLSPHKLELEVTEGFIMDERRDSIAILEALNDLGISVAIDDFGTGYSSLAYLKRLPIRILKIDRSFVSELPHDDEDVAISRAVIALGHSLGMEIIAEGVEKQEQLDFLKHEGCEVMQGYLKGKPVTSEEFETLFLAKRDMN